MLPKLVDSADYPFHLLIVILLQPFFFAIPQKIFELRRGLFEKCHRGYMINSGPDSRKARSDLGHHGLIGSQFRHIRCVDLARSSVAWNNRKTIAYSFAR